MGETYCVCVCVCAYVCLNTGPVEEGHYICVCGYIHASCPIFSFGIHVHLHLCIDIICMFMREEMR